MALIINVDDIVDFSLVNDTILGGKRTAVRVLAPPFDYKVAYRMDAEINSKHANMFPYFKAKVNNVDDPAAYKYITVENANGVAETIGIPWILDSSFKTITVRQVTYIIQNFTESMRGPLEALLANMKASYSTLDSTDVK